MGPNGPWALEAAGRRPTLLRPGPPSTVSMRSTDSGVFCESAIEGAQNDRALAVQKHMSQTRAIHDSNLSAAARLEV